MYFGLCLFGLSVHLSSEFPLCASKSSFYVFSSSVLLCLCVCFSVFLCLFLWSHSDTHTHTYTITHPEPGGGQLGYGVASSSGPCLSETVSLSSFPQPHSLQAIPRDVSTCPLLTGPVRRHETGSLEFYLPRVSLPWRGLKKSVHSLYTTIHLTINHILLCDSPPIVALTTVWALKLPHGRVLFLEAGITSHVYFLNIPTWLTHDRHSINVCSFYIPFPPLAGNGSAHLPLSSHLCALLDIPPPSSFPGFSFLPLLS